MAGLAIQATGKLEIMDFSRLRTFLFSQNREALNKSMFIICLDLYLLFNRSSFTWPHTGELYIYMFYVLFHILIQHCISKFLSNIKHIKQAFYCLKSNFVQDRIIQASDLKLQFDCESRDLE